MLEAVVRKSIKQKSVTLSNSHCLVTFDLQHGEKLASKFGFLSESDLSELHHLPLLSKVKLIQPRIRSLSKIILQSVQLYLCTFHLQYN